MDPGKISAESVAREIDRQANFLEKLGTTVADGFTTSAGTSSLSEGTCTCMGVSAVVQFICHYGINLGICAYAIYVGFKFKGRSQRCLPHGRAMDDYLRLHLHRGDSTPPLLEKCSGTAQQCGGAFMESLYFSR